MQNMNPLHLCGNTRIKVYLSILKHIKNTIDFIVILTKAHIQLGNTTLEDCCDQRHKFHVYILINEVDVKNRFYC